MPLNVNGYQLTNTSGLTFGASSTKLDTSGRLISPNTPGFFGSKTGTASQNRQYPWVVNSAPVNVNTCWNTSTGVFTCPVAGLYYAALGVICSGGGSSTPTSITSGYCGIAKNGSLQTFSYWGTNDFWDTQNLETILSCAAGDTISWAINISPAPDSGTGVGAYGDNHNMSTIWLIG